MAQVKKLAELHAIRDSLYLQLKDTYAVAVAAEGNVQQKIMFNVRHEQVPILYEKLQNIHSDILSLVAVSDEPDLEVEHDYLKKVDDTFYAIQGMFRELFPLSATPPQGPLITVPPLSNSVTRLPKRNLRTFDGRLEDWTPFIQVFSHSVHENAALANIDKFEYLLSCLSGEPLNLIKVIRLSNDNYPIAYQSLLDRYENKRELGSHYWNKAHLLPKLKEESYTGLRSLCDNFRENVEALRALKISDSLEDFILFNLLLEKLDTQTRRLFESEIRDRKGEIPTYKDLCDFLESQCSVLGAEKSVETKQNKSQAFRQRSTTLCTSLNANSPLQENCSICDQSHVIYSCPKFKSNSANTRFKLVKDKKLCVNCLRSHHTQPCPSKNTCRTCHKRHHTLLHFDKSASTAGENSSLQAEPSTVFNSDISVPVATNTSAVNISCVNALPSSVSRRVTLLSTALVDVHDSQGNLHTVRALLDSGSEASFITAKCARTLKLQRNRNKIQVQGIGASSAVTSSASILCQISPRGVPHVSIPLYAHIIPQVSAVVPSQTLQPETWSHILNLKLADPEYYVSRHVDLLLGADVYAQILQPGIIGPPDDHSPSALNTVFGWILSGTVQPAVNHMVTVFHTTVIETPPEEDLNHILKQFWQIEEVPCSVSHGPDDDLCERLFLKNYKRLPSGRFVVPLPFKESKPCFPNSKDFAIRRFYSVERRLKKDPLLQSMYVDFMRDYLETGHMELAPPVSHPGSYYIPHHCVVRPDAVTTKLRVVFDASAKAANNLSLNDTLLVGPKLQQNLVDILLRFRLYPIVFITDVKQMYRQIQVDSKYWDYQRIIWRFHPDEPLSEYRLKTVTYGVSSAPFLALRTIQQVATDGHKFYPSAAEVLQRDIYVDDIITGTDSLEQALNVQTELIELLRSGGFPLRKWSSNNPAFLNTLPAEHCQSPFAFDADPLLTIKVLGLQWIPSNDIFTYQFKESHRPCTKRTLLSELARVFDPMGFLSPLTFYIKHLVQSLWCSGVGWDDPPPQSILNQWQQYKAQISEISRVVIKRQLIPDRHQPCQIHGFCDASSLGYASVVFIRFYHSGKYHVQLIIAKSKVAPTSSQNLTIPRLELCGAVLLSKLLSAVKNILSDHLNITEIFGWTDSSIVLSWIRAPSYQWKQYVSNRVAYIQERVPPTSWHHVQSSDNPADCASRGLLPSKLLKHSLWWSGPSWLQDAQCAWPSRLDPKADDQVVGEEKRNLKVFMVQCDPTLLDNLINRFSSLRTLVHVTSFIFRFFNNCKQPLKRTIGPIDAMEYHNVLLKLVKLIQARVFEAEIAKIRTGRQPSKFLRKLNPFLDDSGLLRVGGRLRHSNLSFEHKHPALLPTSHGLTRLIIRDTHLRHCHPGFRTLHYLLLQNFWILSPHKAIKGCLSHCYRCFRVNPKPLQPPMADLPAFRLQQLKPFNVVGVDFAGPFTITMNRVRGAKTLKAYLCLFICLSTRAVHLEVVSDLSTDAFLAALHRLISRRGHCIEIHSDCGTNFIGASRQLVEFGKSAAEQEHIRWKFNPPAASHFGGIWEAGVKSVKQHIKRVVGDQILTFEELHTLFVQVEGLLNSRPLSPVSSDPNDLSALTPGHFLNVSPITSFPEPDVTDTKISRLSRWQLVQQMQQHFWRRWNREYLHTLQQRCKWNSTTTPISLDSLVVIKDERLAPLHWQLGRVIDVHPGSDGVIRVVTLKTQHGIFKRPVVKVCPLPPLDS